MIDSQLAVLLSPSISIVLCVFLPSSPSHVPRLLLFSSSWCDYRCWCTGSLTRSSWCISHVWSRGDPRSDSLLSSLLSLPFSLTHHVTLPPPHTHCISLYPLISRSITLFLFAHLARGACIDAYSLDHSHSHSDSLLHSSSACEGTSS